MTRYLIILENEGNAWGAYAPDLPGLGGNWAKRAQITYVSVA